MSKDDRMSHPDLPRGAGDPEFYGYKGKKQWIGDKPKVDIVYTPINRREWPAEDYDPRFDESWDEFKEEE